MSMTRRDALLGGAGLAAGAALARSFVPEAHGADHQTLLRNLHAALSPAQREVLFYPWDHPSRQLVNTVSILKNPHVGTVLNAEQMPYVWGLWRTMQSEAGLVRFREPLRAEAGGLDGCVLIVYGDPHSGPCQSNISGGHLQLRGGDLPGGSFGDGMSYGHQVGNRELRVPGNVWAFHSDAANRVLASLSAAQRERAVVEKTPHELTVQLQGPQGRFAGLAGAEMSEAQQVELRSLLEAVLSAYPAARANEALADIEATGGVDALHISYSAAHGFFEDGTPFAEHGWRDGELPYFQIWRIEGPGTAIHFQGYPHVHAYIHVARHPERQHAGGILARTPERLTDAQVRRFMERTMALATDSDLGLFPGELPAQVPAGEVSEGLLWSLDPFANQLDVLRISGEQMNVALRERLGVTELSRTYRLAVPDYYANVFAEEIGAWQAREPTGLVLRDVLVERVRATSRIG